MKSLQKLPAERYHSASAMQAQIERIDRIKELRNSLELYGLNPNTKLHPARAQRPSEEHTLAWSNYQSIMLEVRAKEAKMSTWSVVRAVEELIKIHVHENWAASLVQELEKCKMPKIFAKDAGKTAGQTAQYLWTSAQQHDGTELCTILNRAIREDKPNTAIHAVVFANAINMLLMEDLAPQPWLQKLFQKSFPYPKLLGTDVQRPAVQLTNALP